MAVEIISCPNFHESNVPDLMINHWSTPKRIEQAANRTIMPFKNKLCCVMSELDFAYAKTKAQISCAVTAQLISVFVFATRIV